MTENEMEKKLSPRQLRAIQALLTAGNAAAAAAQAEIAPSTLYRWMREEPFVNALRVAEAEAIEGLSRSLAGLGESATAALRDALDASQKITIRLRASEVVIGNLLKIRELVDIEQRLLALEQADHMDKELNR